MGELRDYFVTGLEDFIDFSQATPCPKLPARVLLDDPVKMVSFNVRKGDCDFYIMVDYDDYYRSHHTDIQPDLGLWYLKNW